MVLCQEATMPGGPLVAKYYNARSAPSYTLTEHLSPQSTQVKTDEHLSGKHATNPWD